MRKKTSLAIGRWRRHAGHHRVPIDVAVLARRVAAWLVLFVALVLLAARLPLFAAGQQTPPPEPASDVTNLQLETIPDTSLPPERSWRWIPLSVEPQILR